eukprot:3851961-Pleurochrysis_carterae.AAC.1
MNSTGRVTPLVTLTRMLGLRCVMRSVLEKRLRSPLAVRVESLSTRATREMLVARAGSAE